MASLIGLLILGIALGLLLGLFTGTRLLVSRRAAAAVRERELLTTDAERDAEATRREAQVEAREQALKLRAEVEQELKDKRAELAKIEERVLTKDEAKRHVLERSEELVRHDLARMVRQLEEEARTDAKRRARNLVADALQRVAASHAAETTVSLVELPSDDMKGRIIGREGRNIRALENLTGVDFIIDDTPNAVVLSAFDGVRREVARMTLEKLLHDIGKAVSHEIEGPHALVGGDLVRRHGEPEAVAHAMEAHHNEVEPQTVEAVIVQAADALSGARPGARGESLEQYVKRLRDLEQIATRHTGVDKVYAMQAGREIRVMVQPHSLDDDGAVLLSHEIAREIEQELEYPGQIKVTVIRESRATDYAR